MPSAMSNAILLDEHWRGTHDSFTRERLDSFDRTRASLTFQHLFFSKLVHFPLQSVLTNVGVRACPFGKVGEANSLFCLCHQASLRGREKCFPRLLRSHSTQKSAREQDPRV
jgi:hypothetical protein